jgi:HEAT repeat protein
MKICDIVQESLVAVLAGEEAPDQEMERHVATCEACSRAARELARTWALLGQEPDRPMPVLTRLRITGALARVAEEPARAGGSRHVRLSTPLRGGRRPIRIASGLGLAALLLLSVATAYWSFRPVQHDQNALIELLQKGQLRHVELEVDEGSPTVRLSLSVPREMELRGRPEEEPIRTVLTELLTAGDARASTRGRACEALRGTVAMSPKVRTAMLQALLSDPNPSVRLKAADALMDQVSLPEVQQVFLKVLSSDPNPGLRVRAIDAVLSAPNVTDQTETIQVLRQAATAPGEERYVQIRAAEYLRGL